MISIFILTLNEEQNIGPCIDSVAWSDDIVVLDSLSSDRTRQIAEARGARVIQRKFDNWSAHQNWAMANIEFKHPWVFYLDADERMTPELTAELRQVAGDPVRPNVAYYCGRRNYFMDKWIRHAMPPGAIMRFFRPPYIRFERLVNPVPVVDGPVGYLRSHFIHYNFSKGLADWFGKHNRYAQFEAEEATRLRTSPQGSRWRQLRLALQRDPAERRKAIKNLSFLFPGRCWLRFFYTFILKAGFLDGLAGFHYCAMISMYEYWIELKIREREHGWTQRTEELARKLLEEPAANQNTGAIR